MKKMIATLLTVCLLLSGCARAVTDEPFTEQPSYSVGNSKNKKVTELTADLSVEFVLKERPEDGVTAAQYALALGLLQNSSQGENLLYSPFSASMGLVMAANGAEGETLTQMLDLLGVETKEAMNKQYGFWLDRVSLDLISANSVWIRKGESVKEEYLTRIKQYLDAQVFQGINTDAINGWVSEKTEGKITSLDGDPDASLRLINAVLLDLPWREAFESTEEGTFTDYAGKQHTVTVMDGKATGYIEGENAVGFLKRYGDSPYTFAAILPDGDVYSFIEELTPAALQAMLEDRLSADVTVKMPAFSYETETDLKEPLKALGVTSAFRTGADFSAVSKGLYISEVTQKTSVDVNAEGTVSSAATDVSMQKSESPLKSYEVTVDRPFVYVIFDYSTSLPVFIGVVATF